MSVGVIAAQMSCNDRKEHKKNMNPEGKQNMIFFQSTTTF